MSVPLISVSPSASVDTDAEAILLVVPSLPDDDALASWPGLAETLAAVGFTGKAGAFLRVALPAVTSKTLAVVGRGENSDLAAVRDAAGAGVRSLTGVESVAVDVLGADESYAAAAAEGAALGAYAFDSYKSSGKTQRATAVTVHTSADVDVARVKAIAEAVALVKDLATTPAEWQSPAQLAEAAVEAVSDLPVEVTVWDEQRLADEGFGGILGVGQGSDRPPRLVRLDYSPADAQRHIALVGKGITFDTGGLSLKPPASMIGMKDDMIGAATVLGVIRAAAALESTTRVTAWMCIADNMPSGRATRPGDVLRMKGGTTVEVLNTDAEGRLVLADGLVAASAEHPDLIIDVATLTGAILIALGTRHTGVFGDDAAVAEVMSASEATAEPAWHMPMPDYLEGDLDSPIADMRNHNQGSRFGGSSFAAMFLRRFVGSTTDAEDAPRIPWAHLDVAGSATNDGAAHGFTDKGATGASVRSLIELVTR